MIVPASVVPAGETPPSAHGAFTSANCCGNVIEKAPPNGIGISFSCVMSSPSGPRKLICVFSPVVLVKV